MRTINWRSDRSHQFGHIKIRINAGDIYIHRESSTKQTNIRRTFHRLATAHHSPTSNQPDPTATHSNCFSPIARTGRSKCSSQCVINEVYLSSPNTSRHESLSEAQQTITSLHHPSPARSSEHQSAYFVALTALKSCPGCSTLVDCASFDQGSFFFFFIRWSGTEERWEVSPTSGSKNEKEEQKEI